MIIQNKKARFDYDIIETYEAGIVLSGFEVKALKAGRGSITESYVKPIGDELFLINATIPPLQDVRDYDPSRTRKLLMHRKQIAVLSGKTAEKGLTLVPLKLYTKDRLVKVLIALAKSRKQYRKREVLKKRDVDRDTERELREKD